MVGRALTSPVLQAEERIMTAKQLEEFAEDPFLVIDRGWLKCRSKAGGLVVFRPNWVQRFLLSIVRQGWKKRLNVRLLIVKSRQQGISTITMAILYCIAIVQRNVNILICADSATNSEYLFEMAGRFQDHVNRCLPISPTLESDNKKKMTWADEQGDTSMLVDNSRNKSLGITKTWQHIELSEISRFSRGEEIMGALIPAMPDLPGGRTTAFLESTAKGAGGIFYRMVQAARAGRGAFQLVFLPWFATEEYKHAVTRDFKRTREEEDFVERYKDDPWGPINNEQLQWRRDKIEEYLAIHDDQDVALGLFLENFPSNINEAFVVSGNMVLVGCGPIIEKRIEEIDPEFGQRGHLQVAAHGRVLFQKEEYGIVKIFRHPVPGEIYVIGADIGDGLTSGAWSTASVFHLRTREQVATVRCKYPPDVYEDVLFALGTYYNRGLVAPECNNMGAGVVSGLRHGRKHREPYENVFRTNQLTKLTFQRTLRWGWNTTTGTLPIMENDMADFVRSEIRHINDIVTLDEMLTYVRDPETGEHRPLSGNYSDAMIGAMIGVQLLETSPWEDQPDREGDAADYRDQGRAEAQNYAAGGSGY